MNLPNNKSHLNDRAQSLYIEQEAIKEAHPMLVKANHPAWDAALILVGERHAKHDLVDLVGYLIAQKTPAPTEGEWLSIEQAIVQDYAEQHLMSLEEATAAIAAEKAAGKAPAGTKIVEAVEEFDPFEFAASATRNFGVGGEYPITHIDHVLAAAMMNGTLPKPAEPEVGSVWKHQNGHSYRVLSVAREDDSETDFVVHKGLHDGRMWVRSAENFSGMKGVRPRFERVSRPTPNRWTDAYILETLNIPGINIEASFEPRELPLVLDGIRELLRAEVVKS